MQMPLCALTSAGQEKYRDKLIFGKGLCIYVHTLCPSLIQAISHYTLKLELFWRSSYRTRKHCRTMHNEDNTAILLGTTKRQTKPFTFVYIQFPSARGNTIKVSDTSDLARQDPTYDILGKSQCPKCKGTENWTVDFKSNHPYAAWTLNMGHQLSFNSVIFQYR